MNTAPLWVTVLQALREFNVRVSLPRTAWSYLRVVLGIERIASPKPILLTFSVSEDYVRVWHHFAKKRLGDNWQIVIGDSLGTMDRAKFPGARLIGVPNHMYHGAKIDLLLKHVIGDQRTFLFDDDKYLLFDPTPYLAKLDEPKVAAVSLSPRTWHTLVIDGETHLPMGTHAVLFRPELLKKLDLRFQPPRGGLTSKYRVFPPNTKHDLAYDTADYANEKLLLAGYRVITETHQDILGYDGMTAPRLLLQRFGKAYVKASLERAEHFRPPSVNCAVIRAVCGMVYFERLYRHIFKESPTFVSGFTQEELVALITDHARLDAAGKQELFAYLNALERLTETLKAKA